MTEETSPISDPIPPTDEKPAVPAADEAPAAPTAPEAAPAPAEPAPDAPVDLSALADFSFGPDWASDAADHTTFSTRFSSDSRSERPRSRFGDRSGPRDSGRESRFGDRPRGPRPPRDSRGGGPRRDRDSRPPRSDRPDRADRPDRPPRPPRDPNAPASSRPNDRRGPRPPRPPRMNVDIAFLPDRERLNLVVSDIKASRRAFPLIDIASRFLEREDSHLLKLEFPKPKTDSEPRRTFFQCRECKRVFTTRAAAEAHVLATHMDLFFVAEEVDAPPPSGTFTCVAKCGFSGELLGPPNFHAYNEKINELWSTRFSNIPKAEYLSRIITVRDEAAIEEWKKSVSRKTVYRLKLKQPAAPAAAPEAPAAEPAAVPEAPAVPEVPEAPASEPAAPEAPASETPAPEPPAAPLLGDPMDKSAAQDWVREHELNQLIRESPRCMVPGVQARRWDDPSLRATVDSARFRERQFPFTLAMALRPAFRHMHLHLFKINARETYVTAILPVPFDEASAAPIDREIVAFLRSEKGPFTRKTLLEALRPGIEPESPEATDILRHILDLITHGVIAELHTGFLFLPNLHMVPPPPTTLPGAEKPAEEKPAETPAAQEASEPPAVPAVSEVSEVPEVPVVPEVPAAPEAPAPEPAAEPAPEPAAPPAAEPAPEPAAEPAPESPSTPDTPSESPAP